MKSVFADTQFWVAIINPRDQWHARALEVEANLGEIKYVTTEAVLTEVLTYFCEYGAISRTKVAQTVELILREENTEVINISHDMFLAALKFYRLRPDKGYSLPDCLSMNVCHARGIQEILTHDHHFTQEGFTILL